MSDTQPPARSDELQLDADDDTLPPGHPAGSDGPVSAGEALSGEGIGTGVLGGTGAGATADEPTRDSAPGDDS